MALIKCKECGREVSDNAASCPHCGNPIKTPRPQLSKPNSFQSCLGCIGFAVLLAWIASSLGICSGP
ncbi:MAG: zinc-ribbon domain-containing protein [Armatimonadetes bacterium]|nr:zinc-ribbon domain-containing protein [Armatimonadota bacterium]